MNQELRGPLDPNASRASAQTPLVAPNPLEAAAAAAAAATAAVVPPAPGSFFARMQRLFGGAPRKAGPGTAPAPAAPEAEEFFEYHNPTLGVSGYPANP